MSQKEAAMADRDDSIPLLGSCLMGCSSRDGFGLSPARAALLLTLSQVGSGGLVQSRVLLGGASEQTPPCMCLGELPNSGALTRSLRDKKQIQLFYLESGERMCEIKVKTIALKSYFPWRFPSLAAEVTPFLDLWGVSEMGRDMWLRDIEKTEPAKACRCSWGQGIGKTALSSLRVNGRRNLTGLSEWCAGPGDPGHQSTPVPPALSHSLATQGWGAVRSCTAFICCPLRCELPSLLQGWFWKQWHVSWKRQQIWAFALLRHGKDN